MERKNIEKKKNVRAESKSALKITFKAIAILIENMKLLMNPFLKILFVTLIPLHFKNIGLIAEIDSYLLHISFLIFFRLQSWKIVLK